MTFKDTIDKLVQWYKDYKSKEPERREQRIENLKYKEEEERLKANIRKAQAVAKPKASIPALGSGGSLGFTIGTDRLVKDSKKTKWQMPESYSYDWNYNKRGKKKNDKGSKW